MITKVKNSTNITKEYSMKKIIMSISLVIAGLGCSTMSQQAYGMNPKQIETLKTQVSTLGKQLFTKIDKLAVALAKNHPEAVLAGGIILTVTGLYIASEGILSKIPKIALGLSTVGVGLYALAKYAKN